MADGERGAKCRRLRSFDLIHNFAVFRGETGLVTLRPSLSLFFFAVAENRSGENERAAPSIPFPATTPYIQAWSCVTGPTDKSRARLHEMTLTSSAGIAQSVSGLPSVAVSGSERRNTSFIYVPAYRPVYPKFNFQSQYVYIAAGMYIQFCAVSCILQFAVT